jgi:NAD(P)-dependent dehydrogenase (short-subunit alcohol dehydrogenase family)
MTGIETVLSADRLVVLVTGASSGIGKCCSEFLSLKGCRVYGGSRNPDLAPAGRVPPFEYLRMDVTSDDSVRNACNQVLEREGRLDVVVNNAGMGVAAAVEDTSVQEAFEQFDVNFFGVLRVCRTVLPIMRKQKAGYIINIGSIGGLIAIPYQGLYSASKFALEGLTEALRLEVGGLGIRAVLIEPGDHRTSFTHNRRFAAACAENPVYRAPFERAVRRMASDEQAGPPPDKIARLVYQLIHTRNPRLRYTVGPVPQRAAVWLKRMLPYSVIEKAMKLYYTG